MNDGNQGAGRLQCFYLQEGSALKSRLRSAVIMTTSNWQQGFSVCFKKLTKYKKIS
jgi:hypothetical protein